MKKHYEKPTVLSESVFEVLAAGCGLANPLDDDNCDPIMGGVTNLYLGGPSS